MMHCCSLALEIGWGTTLAIKTIIILMIVPLTALVLGYVFLLKMMSHMQSRLGPMDPGGFHGWFQLVGDGIKFIQKEDIIPGQADRRVFAIAPAIVVISTFLVFLVIPAGPDIVVKDLNVGVFYALAVSSLSVIGVLMAGWASANKFSLLGALRAAAQLIAYELPLLLAVVGVVIQCGTMSLQGIVAFQSTGSIFGWSGIGFPLILTQFVGFGLFLIASQAELTQTPFDMPVAESELVAGYMVEYTGFRFLFFFIGEFGTAFAFSALAATLYLGGWALPASWGISLGVMRFLGPLVLFAQDHGGLLPDVLGALHLPPPPRGPAAGAGVEVPHPHRPDQHPPHRRVQGGDLMDVREAQAPRGDRRSRHHVQDDAEAGGHRAVPARAGRPADAARGVIALKEENCTVCMLCGRSCPDWCIYIEGHKEKRPPRREGGRDRTVSVLDRFDIDYALCMYCGICVEVCPFDALFWSPDYEYSESNIAKLLHDKRKLGEWMETVPEAEPLEIGAEVKK